MPRHRSILGSEADRSLVLAARHDRSLGAFGHRLDVILKAWFPMAKLDDIAEETGFGVASIDRWLALYRKGGLQALLSDGRQRSISDERSWLTPKIAESLRQYLTETPVRTARQIREWLQQEHGLSVADSTIYKYLRRNKIKLKVPRPSQAKKKDELAESFRRDLPEILTQLDLPRERPVRVWVADEMRAGLHSVTRRVWAPRGVRPSVRVQQKYQWMYCWGAVEIDGEGTSFLYTDTVDLEWNEQFLGQVAATDPEALHVVIYDGAGFHHRNGDEDLPENVRVVVLPPYSPELNPVEKLWDQAKDVLCNRVYETLETLQKDLTGFLEGFWSDARRVRALVGSGFLLESANSSDGKIRIT